MELIIQTDTNGIEYEMEVVREPGANEKAGAVRLKCRTTGNELLKLMECVEGVEIDIAGQKLNLNYAEVANLFAGLYLAMGNDIVKLKHVKLLSESG
jgi:hypothetical protein